MDLLSFRPISWTLRLLFCGFIFGEVKKIKQFDGGSRGFVNAVFPLPVSRWVSKKDDFLWQSDATETGLKKGDRVVFFGYRTLSGWRAKMLFKIF